MIRDINARFLRARFPEYSPEKAEQVLDELERPRGAHHGVRHEDLLRAARPRASSAARASPRSR